LYPCGFLPVNGGRSINFSYNPEDKESTEEDIFTITTKQEKEI
jgi:hypothetical protein